MRISREVMWMDMCEVAARRSTCSRGNVGAMVIDPTRKDVISVGYNGPKSHEDHCHGNGCVLTDTGGCARSIHAERNAIIRASEKLRKPWLQEFHLYCTFSPCMECAILIQNFGVETLYFRQKYREELPLDWLIQKTKHMKIFRVTPSGFIIDYRTNQIVEARS